MRMPRARFKCMFRVCVYARCVFMCIVFMIRVNAIVVCAHSFFQYSIRLVFLLQLLCVCCYVVVQRYVYVCVAYAYASSVVYALVYVDMYWCVVVLLFWYCLFRLLVLYV